MGKYFFNILVIIFLTSVFSTTTLQAQECYPPEYSDVYSITSTTAIISWEDYNDGSSWDIVISTTELSNPSSVAVTETVTGMQEFITYPAQNLIPATDYYYYIRTNCGANHSEWIDGTFTTRCADKAIPYENNFDNEAANTTIPECWTITQGTASITNMDAIHGNVLQLQGYCAVALPAFNVPVNTLRVRFSAMTPNTSSPIQVGIVEDASDLMTYTLVETITLASAGTFYEETVDLGSYSGSGRYIVFRNTGSSRQYIDNVTVSIIPRMCRLIAFMRRAPHSRGTRWERPPSGAQSSPQHPSRISTHRPRPPATLTPIMRTC